MQFAPYYSIGRLRHARHARNGAELALDVFTSITRTLGALDQGLDFIDQLRFDGRWNHGAVIQVPAKFFHEPFEIDHLTIEGGDVIEIAGRNSDESDRPVGIVQLERPEN